MQDSATARSRAPLDSKKDLAALQNVVKIANDLNVTETNTKAVEALTKVTADTLRSLMCIKAPPTLNEILEAKSADLGQDAPSMEERLERLRSMSQAEKDVLEVLRRKPMDTFHQEWPVYAP